MRYRSGYPIERGEVTVNKLESGLASPRALDREGMVKILNVYEKDFSVRREDRTAEFVFVLSVRIAAECEDLPLGSDSAQVRKLLL